MAYIGPRWHTVFTGPIAEEEEVRPLTQYGLASGSTATSIRGHVMN